MPDTQPLFQIGGITFAVSDVLTVGPIVDEAAHTPMFYRYTFLIGLRDSAASIKWRGKRFQDGNSFPGSESDALLAANNARNAVIQAVWPNGHASVIDAAGEVQS